MNSKKFQTKPLDTDKMNNLAENLKVRLIDWACRHSIRQSIKTVSSANQLHQEETLENTKNHLAIEMDPIPSPSRQKIHHDLKNKKFKLCKTMKTAKLPHFGQKPEVKTHNEAGQQELDKTATAEGSPETLSAPSSQTTQVTWKTSSTPLSKSLFTV